MQRIVMISLALALAACATAPAAAPQPSRPQTEAPAPQASRAAQLLAAAGRADAPTQAEVQRLIGAPDIVRRDGVGASLTYRLETCALLLLFTADARNEMRLAQAHPSARQAGRPAPSLEQCAAEATARAR